MGLGQGGLHNKFTCNERPALSFIVYVWASACAHNLGSILQRERRTSRVNGHHYRLVKIKTMALSFMYKEVHTEAG